MPKMVIKSVAEVEKSRKRLRKILFFASLPVLALILFFATKTAIIYFTAQEVISLTEEEKYEEAVKAAQTQRENSFVDPWLAEYNVGVAQYNTSEYNRSITAFENALTYNPPMPFLCYVHNGLSKAYEKQGDLFSEEGKKADAEQYYLRGKQTIEKAPPECFPPQNSGEDEGDPSENGDQGQEGEGLSPEEQQGSEMEDTGERLDEKLGTPEEENKPEDSDLSDEGKRDEIQEQMNQGNKDQQDDQNSQGGTGQPADKPW